MHVLGNALTDRLGAGTTDSFPMTELTAASNAPLLDRPMPRRTLLKGAAIASDLAVLAGIDDLIRIVAALYRDGDR